MVIFVGVLLLIYGLVGVAATVFIAWLLLRPQGLLSKARGLLIQLVAKLQWGVEKTQQVKSVSHSGTLVLGETQGKIGQILPPLRSAATFLGQTAANIHTVEGTLNSVSVPDLAHPTFQNFQFSLNLSILSGIALHPHDLKIAGVGFTIYGPDFDASYTTLTPTVGPFPVITGFATLHPLAPIAQTFNFVAGKVEAVQAEITSTVTYLVDMQGLITDGKALLDDLIKNVIDPLPEQLEEVRAKVATASASPLLVLGPVVVLAYFAFIHVAVALTGLALLFV